MFSLTHIENSGARTYSTCSTVYGAAVHVLMQWYAKGHVSYVHVMHSDMLSTVLLCTVNSLCQHSCSVHSMYRMLWMNCTVYCTVPNTVLPGTKPMLETCNIIILNQIRRTVFFMFINLYYFKGFIIFTK